jgi:hypothetical protein
VQKLIRNDWQRPPGQPFAHAKILSHDIQPEGLDVDRLRFFEQGSFSPGAEVGHYLSVLSGAAELRLAGKGGQVYHLTAGVHLYLPPGLEAVIHAASGTELLRVSSASAAQAPGRHLLLRDERILAAACSGTQPLRWMLTPQYLSRRIFLRHDSTLLSKSGHPVSWFHTSMFDVAGLPNNQDGEPAFKMSYNSRTEFNVCHDVQGSARVRMAKHPYDSKNQLWDAWLPLDAESTYHLNEAAEGPEEESRLDETTHSRQFLRNKHEVHILDGYVSLFCLFDPAPTGVERHRPGEYSDYEPFSNLQGTDLYENFKRQVTRFDEMVDQLSLARAGGQLDGLRGTPLWELYTQGRQAQLALESQLLTALRAEGAGRDQVVARWVQPEIDPL